MKKRIWLFDNIKAVLIFSVALVHFMAAVRSCIDTNIYADFIMLVICSFHMPLFMYISGYFSKKAGMKRVKYLIVMYLVVQILFMIRLLITKGSAYGFSLIGFLSPGFSMWYLFALVIMNLMLPLVLSIKNKPFVLIVFAVISVLVMSIETDGGIPTALVKTLANAIFFFLGVYTDEECILKLRSVRKAFFAGGFALGCVLLILTSFVFHIIPPNSLRIMMLRAKSIPESGYSTLNGSLLFLLILLFAIYMSVMIIGLFPNRQTCISKYGKNSITVYIGQAFVYLYLNSTLSNYTDVLSVPVAYCLAAVLAIAVTVLFGQDVVAVIFRKLINRLSSGRKHPETPGTGA